MGVSDGEITVSPMVNMHPPIVPEQPVPVSPTNSDLGRVMYQAMMFAAAASAAAIAAGYASASGFPDTDTYRYAREIVSESSTCTPSGWPPCSSSPRRRCCYGPA